MDPASGSPGAAAGPNGRRTAARSRLAGLSRAITYSRNLAFLAALLAVIKVWTSVDPRLLLIIPWSLEALVAALLFVLVFAISWALGAAGGMIGWMIGRRMGRPQEGASGGALGCWLGLLAAGALVSLAAWLAPFGFAIALVSPWMGARWLGSLSGRASRGLARLPAQFNGWATRRLVLRRPPMDLRGRFLGAAAGLLVGLAALLPLCQYPEALLLAARIHLRSEPIHTATGTIEWQQLLGWRYSAFRHRSAPMAILELDDDSVEWAVAHSSEAALNTRVLRLLHGWGARRVVLPVALTLPQETPAGNHGRAEAEALPTSLQRFLFWRRPPLPDAALVRLQADLPPLVAQLRLSPRTIVCPVPAFWYREAPLARRILVELLGSAPVVGSAEFGIYYVRQLPTLRARDTEGRPAAPLLLGAPAGLPPTADGQWPGRLPTVRPGEMLLDVGGSGAVGQVPHVAYSTLFSGHSIYDPKIGEWEPPARFFRNRIVFLDTLYQPHYDTPIGELTAMELLAVAFDNLTASSPLGPRSPAAQILVTVFAGALVGRLSLGRSPLLGFARLAGVLLVYLVVAFGLFIYPGIWLPVFPVMAAGLLAFLLVNQLVFAVDEEELQRQRTQQMQYEREMALSREIQTSLLPQAETRVGAFTLASRSEPSREVGGDFCSVFPLGGPEERIGVTLGDVAGKGIRGAMYMTVATTLLEARAAPGAPPGQVLADVNQRLYPKMRRLRMFVTTLYGVLDPATGDFTYASAGQVPPLRLTAAGRAAYLPAAGRPLGCLPKPRYRDERASLAPGDCLLIASDGFVEARNAEGQPLGYEGFRQLVSRQSPCSPDALLDSLFDAIHVYLGEAEHDDLTLMLIHRQPAPRD